MPFRSAVVLMGAMLSFTMAQAQGGFRMIAFHIEPVFPKQDPQELVGLDGPLSAPFSGQVYHLGFGYDKDLEDRLSVSLEAMFSQGFFGGENEAMTLQYRSSFHLMSNQESSAYFGPQIAWRSVEVTEYEGNNIKRDNVTVWPVGLRFGVRGDLRGFYADLYASFVYQIGGEETTKTSTSVMPRPITYALGFDMGIGWDKRTDR
jgi:hypothetical protein